MEPKEDNDSIKMKRKIPKITIKMKKEILVEQENGVQIFDLVTRLILATICTQLKNKEMVKRADVAREVTDLTKQRQSMIEKAEKLLLIGKNEKLFAADSVFESIICEKEEKRWLHNDLEKITQIRLLIFVF